MYKENHVDYLDGYSLPEVRMMVHNSKRTASEQQTVDRCSESKWILICQRYLLYIKISFNRLLSDCCKMYGFFHVIIAFSSCYFLDFHLIFFFFCVPMYWSTANDQRKSPSNGQQMVD